jgi:hypothetical protein
MITIHCDHCGADNAGGARYCANCGFGLPQKPAGEAQDIQSVAPETKKAKRPVSTILGLIVGICVMAGIQQAFKTHKPSVDKALMEAAGEVNKTCPIRIDSETRLDNTIALPNKFQYNYTLVNVEKKDIDTLKLKALVTPGIVNSVKSSPEMKFIRDNKVIINYYYRDKNGVYLLQIPVTPAQYK